MQPEAIKHIWATTLGSAPNDEIIGEFANYINQSKNSAEAERIVFWLLMKSTALRFDYEFERALWITGQIRAYHEGQALPAWKEIPAA